MASGASVGTPRVCRNEVRVLRKFAGSHSIVQVYDAFDANGTAYFVMEFLDGVNLKALMRSMGGHVPPELAEEVLLRVGETLESVHQEGLLHRDVSPENIFVTRDGDIRLIDFGATRFFVGEKSRSLSVVLKPGFAPPEQYSTKGNQGPWTDVYALAATFYNAVSGRPLVDAPDRVAGEPLPPLHTAVPGLSPALSAVIEAGMQIDYRSRIQSARALVDQVRSCRTTESPLQTPQVQVRGTPVLTLLSEGRRVDKWLLPRNMAMLIGRARDRCNIVLDAPNISRVHCSLRYDDRQNCFYLEDLSSNGTYFSDGSRLQRGTVYALEAGDIFYLLSTAYGFQAEVE
ncbi:FHA domain-containing serine/threonine-protein kinase [Oscillospiraceae bacterium OttesenSCG-928-F05]|nr:FHA domain-containing serine/threonine-protein kinase [Oscillospiraceae bacterium OttesenSCG-928-F05]